LTSIWHFFSWTPTPLAASSWAGLWQSLEVYTTLASMEFIWSRYFISLIKISICEKE
jgi:hypothetical protein